LKRGPGTAPEPPMPAKTNARRAISKPCATSLRALLSACLPTPQGRRLADDFFASLTPRELENVLRSWDFRARADQWPPAFATNGEPWSVWLVVGGRGAGKTRTGAEWVRGLALGEPDFAVAPVGRIALVGETAADVRDVMIEGVSGILAVHRRD